jgi:hypothetical protein
MSSLIRPLDSDYPIESQLGGGAEPIVLVNVFTLDQAECRASAWPDRSATAEKGGPS